MKWKKYKKMEQIDKQIANEIFFEKYKYVASETLKKQLVFLINSLESEIITTFFKDG